MVYSGFAEEHMRQENTSNAENRLALSKTQFSVGLYSD